LSRSFSLRLVVVEILLKSSKRKGKREREKGKGKKFARKRRKGKLTSFWKNICGEKRKNQPLSTFALEYSFLFVI